MPEDAQLRVTELERYCSRGGRKLEGALTDLGVDVTGVVAVDVGASTGGFTDCLLQHGAARVYAVDVGHGQLAEKLRQDARVVIMDRTNARHLSRESFPEPIALTVVDASFISLEKLLPAIAFAMVAANGDLYFGLRYPLVIIAISVVVLALWVPETRHRDL